MTLHVMNIAIIASASREFVSYVEGNAMRNITFWFGMNRVARMWRILSACSVPFVTFQRTNDERSGAIILIQVGLSGNSKFLNTPRISISSRCLVIEENEYEADI